MAKLRVLRDGDLICLEGHVSDNRVHRHHAMQLVWARGDDSAQLTWRDTSLDGRMLIIEGGEPHALHLNDGLVCLLESQSALAHALRRRWLSAAKVVSVPIPNGGGVTLERANILVRELAGTLELEADAPDPRIATVLAWLNTLEYEGRWDDVSLRGALRQVHLSESRFLHLFSAEVGTPWRSYLVWRRALVAATIAAAGTSLTEAAHTAGYADSAHLARQFKTLFGFTPSRALEFSHFVQVDV